MEEQAKFEGWAKVEVMGHQTHIGFVRTEAFGQAVMFRVDQPEFPEREYVLTKPAYTRSNAGMRWTEAGAKVQRPAIQGCTVLVGAGSIYRILPCSEDAARIAIEESVGSELKLIEPPPDTTLKIKWPESAEQNEEEDEDNDDSEEDEYDPDPYNEDPNLAVVPDAEDRL